MFLGGNGVDFSPNEGDRSHYVTARLLATAVGPQSLRAPVS